ncbi:MAG: porin family protein, partial [Hyphomicrobium sp.]|nr:porin family protein [Hyphomicrobium sp.]
LHLGGGWGHASTADVSGFVLGAHGGYNFQFDRFVAGVEGDIDASGVSNDGFGTKYREKWLGSIRARLGYSFDRFLVFGTGGFAFGTGQFKDIANNVTRGHAGFALGFGGEMKITNNLSARAEYLHYDFDKNVFIADAPQLNGGSDVATKLGPIDTLRVSVSYKFGGGEEWEPPPPLK